MGKEWVWDRTEPCASCPYRKDAPIRLWHKVEFKKVLVQDADPMGAIFGCHEFNKRPTEEQRPCAGWLLDQKRRNVPNLQLRIKLWRNEQAAKCFNALSPKGLKLFRTIKAMCRANGVR